MGLLVGQATSHRVPRKPVYLVGSNQPTKATIRRKLVSFAHVEPQVEHDRDEVSSWQNEVTLHLWGGSSMSHKHSKSDSLVFVGDRECQSKHITRGSKAPFSLVFLSSWFKRVPKSRDKESGLCSWLLGIHWEKWRQNLKIIQDWRGWLVWASCCCGCCSYCSSSPPPKQVEALGWFSSRTLLQDLGRDGTEGWPAVNLMVLSFCWSIWLWIKTKVTCLGLLYGPAVVFSKGFWVFTRLHPWLHGLLISYDITAVITVQIALEGSKSPSATVPRKQEGCLEIPRVKCIEDYISGKWVLESSTFAPFTKLSFLLGGYKVEYLEAFLGERKPTKADESTPKLLNETWVLWGKKNQPRPTMGRLKSGGFTAEPAVSSLPAGISVQMAWREPLEAKTWETTQVYWASVSACGDAQGGHILEGSPPWVLLINKNVLTESQVVSSSHSFSR